jgi:hypothetical protein
MSHDPLLHVAPPILEADAQAAVKHIIAQTPGQDYVTVEALTPQQVEAVDKVYALQEEESRQVAQLIGVWGAIQFSHALAVDMLRSKQAEEEEEKRRKAQPALKPEAEQ